MCLEGSHDNERELQLPAVEGLDGSEIIFSYGPYAWDGGGSATVAAINNWPQDWEKAVTAFYESAIKAQLPGTATGLILLPVVLGNSVASFPATFAGLGILVHGLSRWDSTPGLA